MKLRPLIRGLSTYVPGIRQLTAPGTGGTDSARYCYSVWLRHLVMARNNGLDPYPRTVAELGPGDSLGIGLAALISGCDAYFALDVVEYAAPEGNLAVFDELVGLFRDRVAIPGEDEFPKAKPYLDSYEWPDGLFDDLRLGNALQDSRLARIRQSIADPHGAGSLIRYMVPWSDAGVLRDESVNMLYSQAVLEHVDDLPGVYGAMRRWLKPAGYMSHQVDFRSHGTTDEWNGHWACSDLMWRLIKGKRPYLLNRAPHSTHLTILEQQGFAIVCDQIVRTPSNLAREELAPRFRSLTDDDLTTSGAFIQAVKQHGG